jgi:chromosome partitioning protein
MGKIIAFANQKGGVGKTTSAVNIAASLGILGKRVLMIDLDPQGNTTSGLGVGKRNLTKTSRELLIGEPSEANDTVTKTEFQNLSLIPSNKTLASVEFDLYELDDPQFRLKEALREIRNEYDYIIIDCPPSLGMITVNALAASDGIIIPMQCEFYSLEGLSQLVLTINKIRQTYNKTLNVTGILITMYNGRLVLSNQVMAELKKHYKDKLFKTPISRGVKLSEAPGFGMPVYYHDKNCKGTAEYMAVAKELLGRI